MVKALRDYDFEELQEISDDIRINDKNSKYYDEFYEYMMNFEPTKPIILENYTDNYNANKVISFKIIGINHDPSNGEDGLILLANSTLPFACPMSYGNKRKIDYFYTFVEMALNTRFKGNGIIPKWLHDMVKTVNKNVYFNSENCGQIAINKLKCKFFIPSMGELGIKDTYAKTYFDFDLEEKIYEGFTTDYKSKIKDLALTNIGEFPNGNLYLNENNKLANDNLFIACNGIWLRDSGLSKDGYFAQLTNEGKVNRLVDGHQLAGIVFGFCI